MNRTKIEWCDFTWNVVTGCRHGCPYCYASKIAWRFGGKRWADIMAELPLRELYSVDVIHEIPAEDPDFEELRKKHVYYPYGFEPTFHKYRLEEPMLRKKPAKIFVSSMGDLFGDRVPNEWVEQVLDTIKQCPQHTFMFLTKNPHKYYHFKFPKNVWIGASADVHHQAHCFSETFGFMDATVKFLSLEPLLHEDIEKVIDWESLDWVIVGAQTGPKAKQPNQEWVDAIIKEARRYNVAIFLKNNLKWDQPIQEYPS